MVLWCSQGPLVFHGEAAQPVPITLFNSHPCSLTPSKALHFHGRLKRLLGQQKSASDRSPFVFFAIATVLRPFSILELQTKTLIFHTKHKLDFTPVACDSQ